MSLDLPSIPPSFPSINSLLLNIFLAHSHKKTTPYINIHIHIQAYVDAAVEERNLQQRLIMKNKDADIESRRARMRQVESIHQKRRQDAQELQSEKKSLTKMMLREQERELRAKQKKREEIRKLEEDAKLKREAEKREQDRKIREFYEAKARKEEEEAMRAEKLVRALEKKEREWMEKLRAAQTVQEIAFEHLESALLKDPGGLIGGGGRTQEWG